MFELVKALYFPVGFIWAYFLLYIQWQQKGEIAVWHIVVSVLIILFGWLSLVFSLVLGGVMWIGANEDRVLFKKGEE